MNSASKSGILASRMLQTAAAGLLALGATQAMGASVTLCAEPYAQPLPGNATGVPMWGYSLGACGAPSSPGPLITVPSTDTTLTVTLINQLKVPTSIVLAGQALPSDGGPPVRAADVVGPACVPGTADAVCRVRSFTGETEPGATRVYTFSNLRPGTYLYQSGTHPQVQVQMGLFGMAKQDAALTGTAGRLLFANATAGFDVDVPVVLSEIDPDQHALIESTLGTDGQQAQWQLGKNSTLKYAPRYFLINGKVFDAANPSANDLPVQAGAGSRVVLRMANAGLQSRSLMLNTGTWKLLTEDGNPYASAREQATALLPAGKTSDALLISTAPANGSVSTGVAIFDRRGGTDNADGSALGGQVARLAQSGLATPSIAAVGAQVANEAGTFALQLQAANVTAYQLTGPAGMTISAGGLISWAVPTGTTVPTSYSVTVVGSGAVNPPASASFDVRVNHTPTLAAIPSLAVSHGTITIAAPGVLAGAADPDGDTLTAVQTIAPTAGTLTLNGNGSFSWSGPQPLTGSSAVTFGVAARDAYALNSTTQTVTLNVAANVAPVASNLGTAAAPGSTIVLKGTGLQRNSVAFQLTDPSPLKIPFATLVTATDADGAVNPASFSATVVKVNPNTGNTVANGFLTEASAVVSADGSTITFTPRNSAGAMLFLGGANTSSTNSLGVYRITYTVQDDQAKVSNTATIFVRVQ